MEKSLRTEVLSSRVIAGGPLLDLTLPSDLATTGAEYANFGPISCTSVGNCVAGGSYYNTSDVDPSDFVTEVNSVFGTATSVTMPTGTHPFLGAAYSNAYSAINGISCVGTTCFAGGTYLSQTGYRADIISSASNTAVEPTLPSDAQANAGAGYDAVSCPSLGACVAVGYYSGTGNQELGLISTQTGGSSFSSVSGPALPSESSSPNIQLSGVSCPSAGNCVIVGTYQDSSGNQRGFLLTQSGGGSYVASLLPAPAGAASPLNIWPSAISCPSIGNCFVGGDYRAQTGHFRAFFSSQLSGGLFSTAAVSGPVDADPTQDVSLNGLDCFSPSDCVAVGNYSNTSGVGIAFVAEDVSGTLVTSAVTSPLGAASASLNGVSCASATACTAVGGYTSTSNVSKALYLNFTHSTAQPAPPTVPNTPQDIAVAASGNTLNATWTGESGATGYECTLLYGYNTPTTFTMSTTSPSCAFTNLAGASSFGIGVVALSSGGQSMMAAGFPTTSDVTTTTIATSHVSSPSPKLIRCVKGKVTRKIMSASRRCPAGFHLP